MDTRQLVFLDRQLHNAHRNAISTELAARGLSEVGHPLLLTILQSSVGAPSGGSCMAQRDLAELLHISPAAVSSSLKSLEKSGYIAREPDPSDARCTRVLLTAKGRDAVEGCRAAYSAVTLRMLSGLSEEDKEQLLQLQQRMLQNLQSKEAF